MPRLSFVISMMLATLLVTKSHSVMATQASRQDSLTCQALYTGQVNESLPWLAPGQPVDDAKAALRTLANAKAHGLDPRNYDAFDLAARARQIMGAKLTSDGRLSGPDPRLVRFNRDLTIRLTCYLQQVRNGQIEPEMVHERIMLKPSFWQAAPALRAAWAQGRISALLKDAPPANADYLNLKRALTRYRAMAGAANARDALSMHRPSTMRKTRAVALETLPQTNPSIRQHIALIELAMERLRWLPRSHEGKRITINIPAFAMRLTDDAVLVQKGRAVVGRPGRSETPFFSGTLSRIEFNPTWFVPHSIAKRRLVPRIRRDPAYLQKNNMAIVLANGSKQTRATAQLLRLVERNAARIEQRPGRKNLLGQVKFVLPNERAIFLHDTDRPELFWRSERAYSNGCVWVDDALGLAASLLSDNPSWNGDRMNRVLVNGKTRIAKTQQPTMVVLTYQTAVANDQGEVQLFRDIYGYDAQAIPAVPRWAAAFSEVVDAGLSLES